MDQKPKNPVGRPPILTPELSDAIIASIARRTPITLAAEANGIHKDTLFDWLRVAQTDMKNGITSRHTIFSDRLKQTEQKLIQEHLDLINTSPERWQAQAWLLERRWWKHFGANSAQIEFDERLAKLEQQGSEPAHGGAPHNVQTNIEETSGDTQE